ncbi:MAG: hypothetical protein ACOC4Y_01885 [bacterium]
MSWQIIYEGGSEKCPEIIGIDTCGILSDKDGLIVKKEIKCNKAQCPLRIPDDDNEAEKMVAGTD